MRVFVKSIVHAVFVFCLILLHGCLLPRVHHILIEENPADWMHDLVRSNPAWRLITSKEDNGDLKGPDVIALSIYGRGDWFVKTGSGIDVWVYESNDMERKLASGQSAQDRVRKLNTNDEDPSPSSVTFGNSAVLKIIDIPSSFRRSIVVVDLDRIFSDHPWCRMVWLDDGIKGMCYVRGELYRREKRIKDSLVGATAVNIARYRQVVSEASDYETFCRLIGTRRVGSE